MVKTEKYDSRSGNSKDDILRFLKSVGRHSHETNLCLKEFSKPLINEVYTWYASLKQGTLCDWGHLISQLNTKFFYIEARFTLVELSRT